MLQLAGFWMALATFLGIWGGHVGVRWLERTVTRVEPPAGALTAAGIGLNLYALVAPSLTLAGVCSIIGITLLWDAYELFRQQRRVLKGHAPANPRNPRHAAYMASSRHATTEDLLDRRPTGRPVYPAAVIARPERHPVSASTD